MRIGVVVFPALVLTVPTQAQTAAERVAIFRAAGFTQEAGTWRACGDPGTASYTPGAIEEIRDLNADGRPDAIVTEGSTFCFGATGVGYTIVSKKTDGRWHRIADGPGIATPLTTRGVGGWPDIEIGGPGFCFPVERWNGRAYALQRHQYRGKPCRPTR